MTIYLCKSCMDEFSDIEALSWHQERNENHVGIHVVK